MKIEFSKKASKFINRLDKPTKDRIKAGLALEIIKKLVLAWDPDYTKVTPAERAALDEAELEFENGETVSYDAINWD